MRASEYFRIARDFGSPAYTPEELPGRPTATRHAADVTLGRALELRLQPAPSRPPSTSGSRPAVANVARGSAKTAGSCVDLAPRGGGIQAEITLPPGGAWLSGPLDSEHQLAIGRFSGLPAAALQPIKHSSAAYLSIPGDDSPIPWELWVSTTRRLRICGLGRA
jgi:hypothetical protein